jgi:hypothetical protein
MADNVKTGSEGQRTASGPLASERKRSVCAFGFCSSSGSGSRREPTRIAPGRTCAPRARFRGGQAGPGSETTRETNPGRVERFGRGSRFGSVGRGSTPPGSMGSVSSPGVGTPGYSCSSAPGKSRPIPTDSLSASRDPFPPLDRVGREPLRAPSPLRTVRESFPSHGSSLFKGFPYWVSRECCIRFTLLTCRQNSRNAGSGHQSVLTRSSHRHLRSLLSSNSPGVYVTRDQQDVGILSDRTIRFVSARLQGGICFFPLVTPAPPTACLTVRLPRGRKYRISTFHMIDPVSDVGGL